VLRRTLLLVVLAAIACARPQSRLQPAVTTIVVVRHAEKESVGTDPSLNAAGVSRAQALAKVAANAHVASIYVTQYRRTIETAQPLIDAVHVPAMQIGIDLSNPGDYPQRLAGTIRSRDGGKTVLVVTHSNVLPAVVKALAGVTVPPLRDDEYDRLYVITLRGGTAGVVAARYGL